MKKDILKFAGRKLYQQKTLTKQKRYYVFLLSCLWHKAAVKELLRFFDASEAREAMLLGSVQFLEQLTRAFFYRGSTLAERLTLIKGHVTCMEALFKPELLDIVYAKEDKILLWDDSYCEKPLRLYLIFERGDRKEGCLTLFLDYEEQQLYKIVFWLAPNYASGEIFAYIGALQGHPAKADLFKSMTKAFYGYRPKNLMLYCLRSFCEASGIGEIYAVTNQGYYAMNHVRADRKLETDLTAFWQECEGKPAEDKRFYVLPVQEHRKTMEELKPSKRALHRRRFVKLDAIKAAVAEALEEYVILKPRT